MALNSLFMIFYLLLFGFVLYLMNTLGVAFPKSINGIDLLLLCLATFRITELIVCDAITRFLREPFVERETVQQPDGTEDEKVKPSGRGLKRFIGELIICPWCIGVWIGTLLAYLYVLFPGPTRVLLLAVGVAAGGILFQLLAKLLDRMSDDR